MRTFVALVLLALLPCVALADPAGPLQWRTSVDLGGSRVIAVLSNPLPPSGPDVAVIVAAPTITYTDAAGNAYSQQLTFPDVTLPAVDNHLTPAPFRFLVTAAKVVMDAVITLSSYTLINLADGTEQVTLNPPVLDGGQSAQWAWTLARK